MSEGFCSIDEIKRKIRSLKKMEIRIRFGVYKGVFNKPAGKTLEWDSFFDMRDTGKGKYSIKDIAKMTKENFRQVIDEFYSRVYYRYYMENGLVGIQMYDPDILAWMGLPPDAGEKEIKTRFRELAKKYHPDAGGDSKKFIELMEKYRRLVEKY